MGPVQMNGLSFAILLLTAFVVVFVESCWGGLRNLLGAQIDLLPAMMVYTGFSAGIGSITAMAVFGGLWFDSLSANPLGLTVLPLFIVGYLIHLNRELVLQDEMYAQACLGFFASAAAPLMSILILLSMGRVPLIGWGSLWQWLVMALGGAAFSPLFFRLFNRLNRALNYETMPETSFRSDREIKRGRA